MNPHTARLKCAHPKSPLLAPSFANTAGPASRRNSRFEGRGSRRAMLALLAVAGLAACGGSTPNGSVPGTGTRTLLVQATIKAENRVDNAADGNGFDTKIEVVVKRGGQVVTDAQVVVRGASGRTLALLGTQGDTYKGSHVGYDRQYFLDVVAGADRVEGAMIAGPSLHRIESPLPGAIVPAGQPVTVRWTRDGAADTASIETKKFKLEATADSGSYVVPGTAFPGKVGETEQDELRITRLTRVGLSGGVAGSQVEATVRNRVDSFLVAARPQ